MDEASCGFTHAGFLEAQIATPARLDGKFERGNLPSDVQLRQCWLDVLLERWHRSP